MRKFEEMFGASKEAQAAIAFNSSAAANAVIHCGERPVFADCGRSTLTIDPRDVETKISPRTRAIMPVHFAGRPCAMNELRGIASSRGLAIAEDSAHAIESEYHGRKAGTFSAMGCLSFYVTKNITTGEGGMVIAGELRHEERIKTLALHGMTEDAWERFSDEGYKHYHVADAWHKYNMTDLRAALEINQLPRMDAYWQRRRDICEPYSRAFCGLPVTVPPPPEPDTRHAYYLFTLLLDLDKLSITRDAFLDEMTRLGIGVGVHCIVLAPSSVLPAEIWIRGRRFSLRGVGLGADGSPEAFPETDRRGRAGCDRYGYCLIKEHAR